MTLYNMDQLMKLQTPTVSYFTKPAREATPLPERLQEGSPWMLEHPDWLAQHPQFMKHLAARPEMEMASLQYPLNKQPLVMRKELYDALHDGHNPLFLQANARLRSGPGSPFRPGYSQEATNSVAYNQSSGGFGSMLGRFLPAAAGIAGMGMLGTAGLSALLGGLNGGAKGALTGGGTSLAGSYLRPFADGGSVSDDDSSLLAMLLSYLRK